MTMTNENKKIALQKIIELQGFFCKNTEGTECDDCVWNSENYVCRLDQEIEKLQKEVNNGSN